MSATDIKRFGEHGNAFGFLRLVFASLVIMAHTPEMVDDSERRELLMLAFGTMSFGAFAVNGFFIISGFLITGSFVNSRSMSSYLFKRVARIYPGFIVSSIFCMLVVAPLGEGQTNTSFGRAVFNAAIRMLLLSRPVVDGAFAGQGMLDRSTALNGAAWTIQYEFGCYLVVMALGAIGALRRPTLIALLAVCLLLIAPHIAPIGSLGRFEVFPNQLDQWPRLTGMFLAGSTAYLFRRHLVFTLWRVILAAAAFLVTLCFKLSANLGFAVFGSYIIFAIAEMGAQTALERINNRNDISYGVYLYGWPIERLLIQAQITALIPLGLLTWLLALAAGVLSWFAVEKRVMMVVRPRAAG